MIKEMEIRSKGVFAFKEGTLYPILHTLENEGLIEAYWDCGEGKRKRKYYRITENGKNALKEKEEEWELFSSTVNHVLREGALCQ